MANPYVLRDKRDFNDLYHNGKSVADRYVVLFYKENGYGYNRTCVVASKKVGNAVARNRARRLLKEAYRTMAPLKEGYDIILIARNTIGGKKCQEVRTSLEHAAAKAKLINKEK